MSVVNGISVDYSLSEVLNDISEIISNAKWNLEFIIDNEWIYPIVENTALIELIRKSKLHNISIKFILQITKSNANYCKKLMKYSEVRHSERLIGCSTRNEKEYFFCYFPKDDLHSSQQEPEFLNKSTQFLYIDNEFFISQQEFMFENLWNNSLPARERIIKIEKGVMEIILNHGQEVSIDKISNQIFLRIIEAS